MTREATRLLVMLHAEEIQRASARERAARRLAEFEPERSEMCLDEAREHRAKAAALAEVLADRDDVWVPVPAQFSLLSDGGGV